MVYIYLKQPPADPAHLYRRLRWTSFWSRLKVLLPTIMIVVGASLIISVGYPIISYELTIGQRSRRQSILKPVPEASLAENKGLISPTNPQVLAQAPAQQDYSRVSTWFNFSKPQTFLNPSNITHYTISIPRLRIKDAIVTIGGDDLSKSLIHYGGTANPGEVGSPVIFGHSILPQFYNPQSYRAIFSLLPTLKAGDEIFINFDGILYKYVVYDYFEVAPDAIDILEQHYNRKELTLVTCVPPGTYLRRGIVKAKLVEI
ncbi:MAG: sortase [Patescibacteria group bacterium]|nr:sortase [Patescibacteria group bacterium]